MNQQQINRIKETGNAAGELAGLLESFFNDLEFSGHEESEAQPVASVGLAMAYRPEGCKPGEVEFYVDVTFPEPAAFRFSPKKIQKHLREWDPLFAALNARVSKQAEIRRSEERGRYQAARAGARSG